MTQSYFLTLAALADPDKITDYTLAHWGADQMAKDKTEFDQFMDDKAKTDHDRTQDKTNNSLQNTKPRL